MNRCFLYGLALAGAAFLTTAQTLPARADLQLCNMSQSRVGVALGYKDQQGWASEGWWNIAANDCQVLLKGPLIARWYYIYAVDYDNGGSWGGDAQMCTRDKLFTIRGLESCEERGYKQTGFFEVDTGENVDFTVRLGGPKTQPAPSN
jgi:uncharacterized membrane protein